MEQYGTSFDSLLNTTQAFPASWQGMPLGDGDSVSLSYIEAQGGDLGFLIGKSDAYDEFHELIKVGRVKVSLVPPLEPSRGPFKQTLHFENASMTITSGPYDILAWMSAGDLNVC